jgi:hypothetical protein
MSYIKPHILSSNWTKYLVTHQPRFMMVSNQEIPQSNTAKPESRPTDKFSGVGFIGLNYVKLNECEDRQILGARVIQR